MKDDQPKKTSRYLKYFLLGATFIMNLLICVIFVPFFITNTLPMVVGFCWLLVPLWLALSLAYAIFATVLISIVTKGQMCTNGLCRRLFITHFLVGIQVFGCLILGMAYNYSQYAYFGGGYLSVVEYEFQSRDTGNWARAIRNSSELTTDTVLAVF